MRFGMNLGRLMKNTNWNLGRFGVNSQVGLNGSLSRGAPFSTYFSSSSSSTVDEEEVLSRVTQVREVEKCREITTNLIQYHKNTPIAVDVEGVMSSLPTSIQIRDSSRNIYIFRVGLNPDLFDAQSGLKQLFQDPEVIKVMHGSTNDISALYRANLKIWGVYDTAMAHYVHQYQVAGESIQDNYKSNNISYNKLCLQHGLDGNPMKDFRKGTSWTPESSESNEFKRMETLSNDLSFYAAMDVENLLDLYELVNSTIDPDFQILLQSLNDALCYRCVDGDLMGLFKHEQLKNENCDLFIENIPEDINPLYFYERTKPFNSLRRFLHSPTNQTGHFIFASRFFALAANEIFSKEGETENSVFNGIKCELVKTQRQSEEFNPQIFVPRKEINNDDKSGVIQINNELVMITEPSRLAVVSKIISDTKCPVTLKVNVHPELGTMIDMFVGENPIIRFPLNHQTLNDGKIADLLSNPSVPKIISSIPSIIPLIATLENSNNKINNLFELVMASTIHQYWNYGKFHRAISSKTIMNSYELDSIFTNSHHVKLLHFYLQISKDLPLSMIKMLKDFHFRKIRHRDS